METMSLCSKQDPLSHFEGLKLRRIYVVFDKKGLEPREFPWQQCYGCHLVSFALCISGANYKNTAFKCFQRLYFIQYLIILVANL